MNDEIKMLMGFVIEDSPRILISGCENKNLLEAMKPHGTVECTSVDCENKENCVPLNPEMPFLPLDRFNVWIVNMDSIRMSEGFVFHLASNTLKKMGILAIIGGEVDDNIARGYGFQVLYHGAWHYYLKASEGKGNIMDIM